jgi:hypothetical protein
MLTHKRTYVVGGLVLFVLLLAGSLAYDSYKARSVVVPRTTFGAVDLTAYEVLRHRSEHPEQFAALVRTASIFVVPANTECQVIGTNGVAVDEPLHVKIRSGAKSGSKGYLWARDVQHQVAVP